MSYKLGQCVEPSKSVSSTSNPSDVKLCLTIEELKTLANDFYANNFEFSEYDFSTSRSLEMTKRDTNIMLKLVYAIEEYEGEAA